MARICLVTPAQPTTNPRLVKEADALAEAGHAVEVLYAHVTPWADESDDELLSTRRWRYRRVGGHPSQSPLAFRYSRRRYRLAHRAVGMGLTHPFLDRWLVDRVLPELCKAAARTPADLYIGHNTAALPAVVSAASANRAKAGFDIEDYFSGMDPYGAPLSHGSRAIARLEAEYLPRCNYLTVVSPEIAEVYHQKYSVDVPKVILNVFPLKDRPPVMRATRRDGPLTLYWVSQTIGDERLEPVIRAMAQLPECNIELHVRGHWLPGYETQLRTLVASSGLPPGRLVSHPVGPATEMTRLAAEHDVGLVLERDEAPFNNLCLTNKIFTYVLAGNAVITTATLAHERLARDLGCAAFSYHPANVAPLVERLRAWFVDRGALDLARRRAWELGAQRYNWEVESKAFVGVVDDVLRK